MLDNVILSLRRISNYGRLRFFASLRMTSIKFIPYEENQQNTVVCKDMTPTSDNSTLNLPELPSLEETRMDFGDWNPLGCLPIIGGLIYLIVTRNYAFSLYLVADCILFFLYMSLSGIKLTVDKTGITFKYFIRKKYIAWHDVVDAYTTPENDHYAKDIIIKSNATTIKFTAPVETHYELAEASIRQHLQRHGKAGNFKLSDDTLSIWAEIPEDIPCEMDYFDDASDDEGGPENYQLRADFISQTSKLDSKTLVIYWDDVLNVRFEQNDPDYEYFYLIVESSSSNMYIRNSGAQDRDYLNTENARFLLAVIRRARETDAKLAIVIPRGLRERYNLKLPGK